MSLDCRLVDVNSDIFTDILRLNSEVFPSNELLAPINLSNNIYANDENLGQIIAQDVLKAYTVVDEIVDKKQDILKIL